MIFDCVPIFSLLNSMIIYEESRARGATLVQERLDILSLVPYTHRVRVIHIKSLVNESVVLARCCEEALRLLEVPVPDVALIDLLSILER